MISPCGGVEGTGALANIEFEVVGTPGSSLAFAINAMLLIDGAITVKVPNGRLSVILLWSPNQLRNQFDQLCQRVASLFLRTVI